VADGLKQRRREPSSVSSTPTCRRSLPFHRRASTSSSAPKDSIRLAFAVRSTAADLFYPQVRVGPVLGLRGGCPRRNTPESCRPLAGARTLPVLESGASFWQMWPLPHRAEDVSGTFDQCCYANGFGRRSIALPPRRRRRSSTTFRVEGLPPRLERPLAPYLSQQQHSPLTSSPRRIFQTYPSFPSSITMRRPVPSELEWVSLTRLAPR